MTIDNFFDNFEKNQERNNNLYNLEQNLKKNLVSPVRYTVEGDYSFNAETHDFNGDVLIDSKNNILGRFTEQGIGSSYVFGAMISERLPKIKLVKAPSNFVFKIFYFIVQKKDDSNEISGSYKGGCGLSKSSGLTGKNIVSMALKRSARV